MRDADTDAIGRVPEVPRPTAVDDTLQLFSHDIRSALSDVIGGLRLVDLDRLDPEARTQIDRVLAAGDTLAALVDAALFAVSGDTQVTRSPARLLLSDWLAAITGRWTGRASERGLTFAVWQETEIPAALGVSAMALDRIIGNLISNALTHAEGAPVILCLSAKRGGDLTMTVRDSGPGYPEAVLDCAARGGTPAATGACGRSGLGLRIAADLSAQIEAGLVLSNPSDGGAQAVLRLPARRLDWDMATPQAGALPDLTGLRLLVAEDNLTNQTILRQLLDSMGAITVFAGDGAAALEALEQHAVDLALIDIEMPRLSGLEVMRRIRARGDALAGMPLVALTAYVLRDNREAIYAAGADGIIGKPIASAAEFGRAILRYAGRPTGRPEPEDILHWGRAETGLGPKLDQSRFDALLDVAGPDGVQELITRLHEDLMAARGALDTAVTARDLSEIRAQTHILIAVAGAVGAERLRGLCEVLNIAAKRKRVGDLAALHEPCRADLMDLIARVADVARTRDIPLARD